MGGGLSHAFSGARGEGGVSRPKRTNQHVISYSQESTLRLVWGSFVLIGSVLQKTRIQMMALQNRSIEMSKLLRERQSFFPFHIT